MIPDKSISPFILTHKDDPVAWRAFGEAALAEARTSGKPVYLCIGYLGCFWCQALGQESFADPETAALINDNFIPILVDRDERPDIDQIYQAASTIMGHTGGWPLNVFLTGEGVPFFVGGYMSREERMDRPSFKRVLGDMTAFYRDRADEVARNGATVMGQLGGIFNRDMRGSLDNIQMEMAAIRIGQRYDIFMGGVTGATKFPAVPLLDVLWRAHLRTGIPQFLQLITTTMNNILMGGLYDHVGGGFFRYTSDERWLMPQFEKTLSDNALLVEFMTQLWQFNRNELCRQRVKETIDWLLREMKFEGAFASGLASSSEGEEGKYYVWTEAEIDAALSGTFTARFKQVYGVRREGDFNGKTILRRGSDTAPPSEADEALMAKQRANLLEARRRRVAPARDDKLLTDWNGLAIKALAFAGAVFERPEWTQTAVEAFEAIIKVMGEDGVLYHAWAKGGRGPRGFADDYAFMAAAALQLFEATGEQRYVTQARAFVRTLDAEFWDEARGGYHFAAKDSEPLIVRTRIVYDQPAPSANGAMISVLTRLALLTGENDYGMRAQRLLEAFAGEFSRNPISCGEYLNGFETFATGLQMVVVGKRSDVRAQELVRAIWGKPMPTRFLVQVETSEELPANHPAFGKELQNGQPTVYLCQRNFCADPITSAVALGQTLTLPRAAGAV